MNKNFIILLLSVVIIIMLAIIGLNYIKKPSLTNNNQNQPTNENLNVNDNKGDLVAKMIVVDEPKVNTEISSPVTVSGRARGIWFFEASFPIAVYDTNNQKLGTGIAQAKSDWMTEDFVDFEAQVEFSNPGVGDGYLLVQKDNPSGLPQNDAALKIPIKFSKSADNMTVKVFFGNEIFNPSVMDCSLVYPIERQIPKTEGIAWAALEKLLIGPTEIEKQNGYYTSLNTGVGINSLKIENKTAYVDFDSQLEQGVGGSCKVLAITSQIRATLKQFETIEDVVISIDGRTEDILQP